MFTGEGLATFVPILQDGAEKLASLILERGKSGMEVEVHEHLGQMTLRNILLAAFGLELDTLLASSNGKSAAGIETSDKHAKLLSAAHAIFYIPY